MFIKAVFKDVFSIMPYEPPCNPASQTSKHFFSSINSTIFETSLAFMDLLILYHTSYLVIFNNFPSRVILNLPIRSFANQTVP